MQENILVIFGGASSEHDVSIVSAVQAMSYIDTNFYNIIPVYVDQNNVWYTGENLFDLNSFSNLNLKKLKRVALIQGYNHLYKKTFFGFRKYKKIDCAMVVMHGINGEDGKIMGLLDMCNIGYTVSNMCESAVCMDKCIFKYVLGGLGINNVNGICVNEFEFRQNPKKVIDNLHTLYYPMIVKPATQGSSIGISVANNDTELENALVMAFSMGEKVLVEKYLKDIVEVNVAIVKDNDQLIISELERPIKSNEILSFENKYLNDTNTMASLGRVIPADISDEHKQIIIDNASKVYNALNLKGVVRFDFIISDDVVYLNEINTIPGSLAYYLFTPMKISYSKLINIIFKNSYKDFENQKNKIHKYDSTILKGKKLGIKK